MLDFNVNLKLPNPFEKVKSDFTDKDVENAKSYVYAVLHKNEQSFHEYIGMDLFLRFNLIVRYVEYMYFVDLGSQEILDFLPDSIHNMRLSLRDKEDSVPVQEVVGSHIHSIYRQIREMSNDFDSDWEDWRKIRGKFYRELLSVTYPFFMNQRLRVFVDALVILQSSEIVMGDKKHGPLVGVISDNFAGLLNHAGREFYRISENFPSKFDRIHAVISLSQFQAMASELLSEDMETIVPYLPKMITKELVQLGRKL